MQSCRAQSQRIHLQNTPASKDQGTVWEKCWEKCKSQSVRKFSRRLYLLVTSEATLIKSHQQDCLEMSWTRVTPTNVSDCTEENPLGLNPAQRIVDNSTKLGEVPLPEKNGPIGCQKVCSENIHTSNTKRTQQVIFGNFLYR